MHIYVIIWLEHKSIGSDILSRFKHSSPQYQYAYDYISTHCLNQNVFIVELCSGGYRMFCRGGGGGGEHLLAGRWSLSKRRNSGSHSRSVVIHVVSRLCLVTIST